MLKQRIYMFAARAVNFGAVDDLIALGSGTCAGNLLYDPSGPLEVLAGIALVINTINFAVVGILQSAEYSHLEDKCKYMNPFMNGDYICKASPDKTPKK